MTSKADYLAAAALLTQLANAQPDDGPSVPPPPPPPPPPPSGSPFDVKSYYPPNVTVNMESAEFDPATKQVHVKVSLSGPTPRTIYAHVLTKNGTITWGYKKVDETLVFRPGDPLERTVTINFSQTPKEGAYLDLMFPVAAQGGRKGTPARLTAKAGAIGQQPVEWTGRPPRTFNPTGTLAYDLDVPNMKFRDGGSADAWNTRFFHGRTHSDTGETGLYMDGDIWPDAEPPFSLEGDTLRIHSQAFPEPGSRPTYDGVDYHYGAAVLTGQQIKETHLLFGQYEFEAMMPDREDSWPALWFLGEGGWPPELDLYEGFGFNNSFDLESTISSTIHGGPRNAPSFAPGAWITAANGGFTPDITSAFHKYQVDIQPDYITCFLDGKETYQFVNPFLKEKWYPLIDVGVRTSGSYSDGSGDMLLRGFRAWRD